MQALRENPAPLLERCARATMRARARTAAERWLAATLPPLIPRAARRDALVLAYHGIVPPGERAGGERALHLPLAAFAAQLERLCRTHDVVPLPDLLRPARPGARPRAALTFDDAYRGAVTAGVDELAARGLPATVFVVSGRVGGGAFWWDALAGRDGALPGTLREDALRETAGDSPRALGLALARGIAPAEPPPHALPASAGEIRRAASVPGITLGSHTVSHPDLSALDPAAVEWELAASLACLRGRFGGAVIPWLAYPYGRWSPGVARAAAAAGYRGALRVEGGAFRAGAPDPFALPRVNVPAGLSPAGLALRAAGMLSR